MTVTVTINDFNIDFSLTMVWTLTKLLKMVVLASVITTCREHCIILYSLIEHNSSGSVYELQKVWKDVFAELFDHPIFEQLLLPGIFG